MNRSFVYPLADRVVYGAGTVGELPVQLARLEARRAFVITGQTVATTTKILDRVKDLLGPRLAGVYARSGEHVPRSRVIEAAQAVREAGADSLISLGGGSPVDTAKAVAFAVAEGLTRPEEFDAYSTRFVIGDGPKRPFTTTRPMPSIAVTTTLSAGEHTANAGLSDEGKRRKDGVGHPLLAPKIVILDPELTRDTPAWLWASTGVRALDHAVERFYTPGHQPLSDPLCLEAIRLLVRFLPAATRNPDDLDARLQCQIAAWLSIYGAFNAPVGLSHAIGHQLGGRCRVPHGVTSCITLARVMAFNAPVIPDRMAALAAAMGASDAPTAVDALVKSLGLPTRLSETGKVSEDDLAPLAHETFVELRPGHNPRPVTSADEILAILGDAW